MGIIEDLRAARTKDEGCIKKLVESLYSDCLKMVKFKNKLGYTSLSYTVPPIYIGYPVYDSQEASYCLSKLLKKKGFKVIQNKIKLNISWN